MMQNRTCKRLKSKQEIEESYIDRLPDELLISIVSRLPVVEAGRMSILARRWRYFWTYNPHLTFDGSRVLRALEYSCKQMTTERIQFMKGVNRALKSLSCTSIIDELRIVFDLDQRYARVINQWLRFAFSRGVRRLELDLAMSYVGVTGNEEQRFIFPNVFRDSGCECESLVSLSLREVEVSGEVLELFLSKCPFLEELRVHDSSHLKSLRVGGCPSLRHLEIACIDPLTSLEICAPNLRSLTWYGRTMSMSLNNVLSTLTSLYLEDVISTQHLFEISSCLPQLETLGLHTRMVKKEWQGHMHLPRLKKLIFDICGCGHESLVCYTPLIDGAPLLREIVLKLTLHREAGDKRITINPAGPGKGGRRHECLEVLRIEGFCGMRTDVELAQYVIDNSVALKKVVIDLAPPLPLVRRNAPYYPLVGLITVAAQGISLLKAILPVGVQMVVL